MSLNEPQPLEENPHLAAYTNYGSTETSVTVTSDATEGASRKGPVLSFHEICFTATVKKDKKIILDNVSGVFDGGVNAILGPTGSGKSSLLDVLAGRKDPRHVMGTVLLDGKAVPSDFRLMTGYVVQDDVVMGTLSIRENLAFSAALRLPQRLTAAEREKHVDLVIQELQLSKCADTRVGTEFTRGVSGGERKRCNIGMELITAPTILFLDEPTSGLDANTAGHVMSLLSSLAETGRTIIFSIHQPRYTIYRLFDNLVLLNGGRCAYHGSSKDAIEYFAKCGYPIEPYNNPADFFLDLLMGAEHRDPAFGPQEEPLTEIYDKSDAKAQIDGQLAVLWDNSRAHGLPTKSAEVGYKTSFGRQLGVVSTRTVKNLLRNPRTSVLQLAMMVLLGALVGAIYWQVNDSKSSGLQNRVGALFFIIMNLIFGNLDAVELFIKERAIFIHENASGYYRVSSYFLAKVLCDMIPRRTIPPLIFCAIAYYMIGFQSDVEKFFIFSLTMVLVAVAGSALAFFFSATVQVFAIANLLIALCYVFMMLFGGFVVNVGSVLSWLQWIKWLSFFRYGLNAASINELHGKEFCDYDVKRNISDCLPGDAYLTAQGIPFGSAWDLWQNILALASMAVIMLVLAYVQLRRLKKLK
ncbi:ATP-binding cassette sub-family G member 2 [Hypsibius exemplaris]|uniref:ATP-binding cassette sub-family G member 2 n=1 Tax=Hypsibius exemplaris TaxID=2072580 RepID=A0A1W0WA01_HYPEX|nr:ATP-binding cassette sub-family G member 2 [Hypsibius exemplaris]